MTPNKPIYYNNDEELQKIASKNGLILPSNASVEDPTVPIEAKEVDGTLPSAIPDELLGEYTAAMIERNAKFGYVPNKQEAIAYRKWKSQQEVRPWETVGNAISHTAATLGEGAWELTKDTATLKVPKVLGSLIEGAALGTKNWMYMMEQARFDENSFLHKMLYNAHSSDDEYYYNLRKTLELQQVIEKDAREGILLNPTVKVGGFEFDLTNAAVVQAVSFVADPSWLMPNLGIESTLAKGARGAANMVALNEQFAKAELYAASKAQKALGGLARQAEATATIIEKGTEGLAKQFKELTGIDAIISPTGLPLAKDQLERSAMSRVLGSTLALPAWGVTSSVWGLSKVVGGVARTGELAAELVAKPNPFNLRMSERVASTSENSVIRATSGLWARTGSPLVEWATKTAGTVTHSGVYGGVFGLAFGGEEGFWNGLGSGFVIGGAFHQVGVLHNAASGGDAVRDTVKNFLWSTSHYDYNNQKGVAHLLEQAGKQAVENGKTEMEGKLQMMSDIAASERLKRGQRRLILREEDIKAKMTDLEWATYERHLLANPDFGGVAFRQALNGEVVTIINTDRASRSAVKEELFHTLIMDERYGSDFKRKAMEVLIGTEDKKGVLYTMPRQDALALLRSFKDQYLKLDNETRLKINEARDRIISQQHESAAEAAIHPADPVTVVPAKEIDVTPIDVQVDSNTSPLIPDIVATNEGGLPDVGGEGVPAPITPTDVGAPITPTDVPAPITPTERTAPTDPIEMQISAEFPPVSHANLPDAKDGILHTFQDNSTGIPVKVDELTSLRQVDGMLATTLERMRDTMQKEGTGSDTAYGTHRDTLVKLMKRREVLAQESQNPTAPHEAKQALREKMKLEDVYESLSTFEAIFGWTQNAKARYNISGVKNIYNEWIKNGKKATTQNKETIYWLQKYHKAGVEGRQYIELLYDLHIKDPAKGASYEDSNLLAGEQQIFYWANEFIKADKTPEQATADINQFNRQIARYLDERFLQASETLDKEGKGTEAEPRGLNTFGIQGLSKDKVQLAKQKIAVLVSRMKEVNIDRFLTKENRELIKNTLTGEERRFQFSPDKQDTRGLLELGRTDAEWNKSIEMFEKGHYPEKLTQFFEEFLAAYWNRFVDDKPLDYLMNGGELGILRNVIETAKEGYQDTMYRDLKQAGGNFKWGQNPDHFFIDQNTKQRIRIPELDRLMKHFVKVAGKERYDGWVPSKRVLSTVESIFTNKFEHLYVRTSSGSIERRNDKDILEGNTKALTDAITEIAEYHSTIPDSEKGLTFTVYQSDGETPKFSFSNRGRSVWGEGETTGMPTEKQEKAFWAEVEKRRKQRIKEGEKNVPKPESRAGLTNDAISETHAGAEVPASKGEYGGDTGTGWSSEKRNGFWQSVFEGNPRLKITGVATKKELEILGRHLDKNTVRTFEALNQVIEQAKFGTTTHTNNVVNAVIETKEMERGDGTRRQAKPIRDYRGKVVDFEWFHRDSTFVPAELSLYFKRKRVGRRKEGEEQQYRVTEAAMEVKVLDIDALDTRENYAWDKWDDSDMTYQRVRRLFGTRANLRGAIKEMLRNYSLGNRAEAGADLFGGGREARAKRDIVNAIIGFHPTQEMVHNRDMLKNDVLRMQLRDDSMSKITPKVITSFAVDRIGKMRLVQGEGFQYNHDNNFPRHQQNMSPSKGSRDHEGNPLAASALYGVRESVYRNREGEPITVYSHRTHDSVIKPKGRSIYDYADDSLGQIFDRVMPSQRGSNMTSESGWLHFSPDPYEGGFMEQHSYMSGNIDTQRHIDLRSLGYAPSFRQAIATVGDQISMVTGLDKAEVLRSLLSLRTNDGVKFEDLYTMDSKKPFNSEGAYIDQWLTTKSTVGFFRELGIHSVEYAAQNPVNYNEYSRIAITDGNRFIHNVGRDKGIEKFAFSPSVGERLKGELARSRNEKVGGVSADLLRYVFDKDGNQVPNPKLITPETIQKIVNEEAAKIELAKKEVLKQGFADPKFWQESINTLKPYVVARLRQQFKNAPAGVLEQIAELSLKGYNGGAGSYPWGKFGDEALHSSFLIHGMKRFGITPQKIYETGIPVLGHWFEMSDLEWQMTRRIPQFAKVLKQLDAEGIGMGKSGLGSQDYQRLLQVLRKEGYNTDIKTNAGIDTVRAVKEALGFLKEYGGYTGWVNELATRQEQLVHLLDQEYKKKGILGDDATTSEWIKGKKLRALFAEKTKDFVRGVLASDKLQGIVNAKARGQLLKVQKGHELVADSIRDIATENAEAHSILKEHQRNIERLFSQEAEQRLMETLSAFGEFRIYESNKDGSPVLDELGRPKYKPAPLDLTLVDMVRSYVYERASKGDYEIGSIEAIRDAYNQYSYFVNAVAAQKAGRHPETYKPYRMSDALKFQYAQALTDLEAKGFHGIAWKEERKAKKSDNVILSINKQKIEGIDAWTFDAANWAVVETAEKGQRRLTLYNENAEVVMYDTFPTNDNTGNQIEKRKDFLRRSTLRLNQDTGVQSVFGHNFVQIEGVTKDWIISQWLRTSGQFDPSVHKPFDRTNDLIDTTQYELYKKGDTFIAMRKATGGTSKDEMVGSILGGTKTITAEVALLQKTLEEGRIPEVRDDKNKITKPSQVLTDIKREAIREKLTTLMGTVRRDAGTMFKIDRNYNVVDGLTFQSISDRIAKVDELYTNGYIHDDFDAYIGRAYRNFDLVLERRKASEQRKMSLLLSEKLESIATIDEETGKPIPAKERRKGNLLQLKEIAELIQEQEAQYKQFLHDETVARQNKDKAMGLEQRTAIQVRRELVLEKDAAQERMYDNDNRALSLENELIRANAHPTYAGWTPEAKDEFAFRLSMLDRVKYPEPKMPQGANSVDYVTSIKQRWQAAKVASAEAQLRFEKLHPFFLESNPEIVELKKKATFLIEQYGAAKGIKFVGETTKSFFKTEVNEDTKVARTIIDIDKLKAFKPNKSKTSFRDDKAKMIDPYYLPDSDGILGKPEVFETEGQLRQAFLEGLFDLKSRWKSTETFEFTDSGVRRDITAPVTSILKAGRDVISPVTDTAKPFNPDFERRVVALTTGLEAWVRDPVNREFVETVQTRYEKGEINDFDMKEILKNEWKLSQLSPEAKDFIKTDELLESTKNEIYRTLGLLEQLDRAAKTTTQMVPMGEDNIAGIRVQTLDVDSPQAIALISKLKQLKETKEALETRIENFMKLVDGNYRSEVERGVLEFSHRGDTDTISLTGNPLADQALLDIIAKRKGRLEVIEQVRKNEEQRRAETALLRKSIKKELERKIARYDEKARQMGFESSRQKVSFEDGTTSTMYWAFPTVTSEISGLPVQHFSMETTIPKLLNRDGTTASYGEQYSHRSGQVFREVTNKEALGRRPTIIADYMYYAEIRKQYHLDNPDQMMSAEEAALIEMFEPDYAMSDIFKAKKAGIEVAKLKFQEQLMTGIQDKFRPNMNGITDPKRERFMRMFISDALTLVSSDVNLRREAYKRINGLTDEQFAMKVQEIGQAEMDKRLVNLEVIENALMQIKSGKISARPENKWNEYEDTYLGKKRQFVTKEVSLTALMKMEGFKRVLREEMAGMYQGSMYDGLPVAKREYEALPDDVRLNMRMPLHQRLTAENSREMMVSQRNIQSRYQATGEQAWFMDRLNQIKFTGDHSQDVALHMEMVQSLLSETMLLETSLQRYSDKIQGLQVERPFAVDGILSLDDSLQLQTALKQNGVFYIDWNDTNYKQYRTTKDGRYIVHRTVSPKGEESFGVYFHGEKIKNKSGVQVFEVPTVMIGEVGDLTQAQLLLRMFEDDIKRVRLGTSMVEGGNDRFTPYNVNGGDIPTLQAGKLPISLKHISNFVETILDTYLENGGNPDLHNQMREQLANIGEYSEPVYFVNRQGKGFERTLLITPTKRAMLRNNFTEKLSPDGHKIWQQKPAAIPATPDPIAPVVTEASAPPPQQKPTTPTQDVINKASMWDVVSEVPMKANPQFKEWTAIRNRLNYLLVKTSDGKYPVYKLFNQASILMGQYYTQREAVDEVLNQEVDKK